MECPNRVFKLTAIRLPIRPRLIISIPLKRKVHAECLQQLLTVLKNLRDFFIAKQGCIIINCIFWLLGFFLVDPFSLLDQRLETLQELIQSNVLLLK